MYGQHSVELDPLIWSVEALLLRAGQGAIFS